MPDISIGDITIAVPGIWSLETGELMTITIAQNIETKFHGPWINYPMAYLAVSIRIEGSYQFGLIKIVTDTSSQCVWITEYVWNSVADQTIQSGQTDHSIPI